MIVHRPPGKQYRPGMSEGPGKAPKTGTKAGTRQICPTSQTTCPSLTKEPARKKETNPAFICAPNQVFFHSRYGFRTVAGGWDRPKSLSFNDLSAETADANSVSETCDFA
jgi:hypothetical protein